MKRDLSASERLRRSTAGRSSQSRTARANLAQRQQDTRGISGVVYVNRVVSLFKHVQIKKSFSVSKLHLTADSLFFRILSSSVARLDGGLHWKTDKTETLDQFPGTRIATARLPPQQRWRCNGNTAAPSRVRRSRTPPAAALSHSTAERGGGANGCHTKARAVCLTTAACWRTTNRLIHFLYTRLFMACQ